MTRTRNHPPTSQRDPFEKLKSYACGRSLDHFMSKHPKIKEYKVKKLPKKDLKAKSNLKEY
jgi:hypothetical protein